MLEADRDDRHDEEHAEELFRRALLDSDQAAALALKVAGLPLSDTVTVIFHGRRDLGTIQTYVTSGGHGAGESVRGADLLRVPCDLDLADAEDRDEAEHLYSLQAAHMRDAIEAADNVLAVWRESLEDLAESEVMIDRSVELGLTIPAHRLLPLALRAKDRSLIVTAVCTPRTLLEGRPPLGIACAQPDVARVYALPDDPERCLEDFFDVAGGHARDLARRLEHQEASVERFLELSADDTPPPPAEPLH
jgi:hypothetical protein